MHALIEWLGNGDWRPTFEGVATFLTAAVALVAAWIAYRAVKTQIAAEKNAREEQENLAKRSVVIVLLFEIDSVYQHIIRETFLCLKEQPFSSSHLDSLARKISIPVRFAAYESNMGFLGGLSPDLVEPVVRLYGMLMTFLTVQAAYALARDRRSIHGNVAFRPLAEGFTLPLVQTEEKCIADMRNMQPSLSILLKSTCRDLCDFADADWVAIRILSDGDL